jgi:hypothetical protein
MANGAAHSWRTEEQLTQGLVDDIGKHRAQQHKAQSSSSSQPGRGQGQTQVSKEKHFIYSSTELMLQLATQYDLRDINILSDYLDEEILLLVPIQCIFVIQLQLYHRQGDQTLLNLGDLVVLAQGYNNVHIKSDLSRPFRREILHRAAIRAIWMRFQAQLPSLKYIRQPDFFCTAAALMLAFRQEILPRERSKYVPD